MSGNLTWKKENGEWGLEGVDLATLPPTVYGALSKLKDIEHPSCPTNGDVFRCKTDKELADLTFCPRQNAGRPLLCQGRVSEVSEEECDKCALDFYRSYAEV